MDRSLFEICRAEYARLNRELYSSGLDPYAMETTRRSLSEFCHGRAFLKAEAYRPTGLALGCPLPQESQTRRLFRLACLVEAWLSRRDDLSGPHFAHVPPPYYHITIVNRTHYEVNTVQDLQEEEKEHAQEIISSLGIGPIQVVSHGLLFTQSGRLLLKCLPVDDRVLFLRRALTSELPQLAVSIPKLVHIKLGHLMLPLSRDQLIALELWLRKIEIHACLSLKFSDLFTPLGRIKF